MAPPLSEAVAEMATAVPETMALLDGAVIETVAVTGVIVTASVWVPVPPALVALRVSVEAPAVVGVPEMSPVVALSARPAGNSGARKLVGLFGAVSSELCSTPPWLVAGAALVTAGVVGVIVTASVWVPVPPALVAL